MATQNINMVIYSCIYKQLTNRLQVQQHLKSVRGLILLLRNAIAVVVLPVGRDLVAHLSDPLLDEQLAVLAVLDLEAQTLELFLDFT